jgi:hypothetical protein
MFECKESAGLKVVLKLLAKARKVGFVIILVKRLAMKRK